MSRIRIIVVILLITAAFGGAQAQSVTLPDLLIYNVWVRPTAPAPAEGAAQPEAPLPGTVSGAYMTIENVSDTDYTLVGVDAAFAEMSMLHQTSIDDKGISRMRMISGLDIPAGETASLAPVGYHAMLMNVLSSVYPGQAVALTLTFEDANGEKFEIPVGALATDFPPEADTLIVANVLGVPNKSGFDVWMLLENRGEAADALTGITSGAGGFAGLMQSPPNPEIPVLPLEIPANGRFDFLPEATFIQVSQVEQPPGDAAALTLTFASGKTLTVAVPITGETP